MKNFILIIILLHFTYADCPDGLLEDDCGDCWQPYCYCLSDHTPNFDISQNECEETGCWWIGPGGMYEPGDYEFCLFDPYWNMACTGCLDSEADNYDAQANIGCDDNCNGDSGDCCEYSLDIDYSIIQKQLKIKNVFPNPFNPQTQITIDIPKSDLLKINIYDISGRLIITLYDNYVSEGTHTFTWNAKNYQSGIYIIKTLMNKKSDSYFIHLIK